MNEYRNDYQSVLLYHVDGHHQHLSLKITRDSLSYSTKASVDMLDKNAFIKGDVNIIRDYIILIRVDVSDVSRYKWI